MVTLRNPTRYKDEESEVSADALAETVTWPHQSRIAALMHHGFSYDEAYHMSFADYRRYNAIFNAWSIPADKRDGGVVKATQADIDKYFASDDADG